MPMAHWCLFPALTMSLGWGLRGFIGGGPLGAMIPGALVALALCLLLRRDHEDAAVIAALGAVGIGFGGQMTYGQTIGHSFVPETMWFGLFGLALKGAIWGLLGGGVVGIALDRQNIGARRIGLSFLAMLALTWVGWKLINEPKLIYFSNRLDRPRPEIWAGLALGALAMLAVARSPVAWRFAARSFVGGGFGFGVGAWIQVAGRTAFPHPWIGYWKVMEFFFGFWFGFALGFSAWKERALIARSGFASRLKPVPVYLLIGVAVVAGGLWLHAHAPIRFGYTLVGAGLMALALRSGSAAWNVAIAMTYCAFSIDYLRARPAMNREALWVAIAVTSLAVSWLTARWGRVLPLFLLLLWTANANSYLKSFTPPAERGPAHLAVEIVFTILGIASTLLALKTARSAVLPQDREEPALDVHVGSGYADRLHG